MPRRPSSFRARRAPAVAAVVLALCSACASGAGPSVAPSAAAAQAGRGVPPLSAPISDVRYEVTFDAATARERTLRVAMTFTAGGTDPVLLSLPAWTPGAYEISEFARWVSSFSATGPGGRALEWDKLDYDTWRVRPAAPGPVTVRFDYRADALDNAMSWSRPDFALFNGTNVFLYPEGRGSDYAATVAVRTQPGWSVVTAMPRASAPDSGHRDATPTFAAANYHDLVDMPFFVGVFDLDSVRVQLPSGGERWVRLASYPAGGAGGARRSAALRWLRRIVPPEAAVFGETPFDEYTVMQIVDSSYEGASGLEHQSSHVDVLSPAFLDSPMLASLYAHEIFHAWNVKRLRPADLVPYRYDAPQPTTLLWVSEGVTDYYADLAMARGGLVDSAAFARLTSDKVGEVAAAPPTSLEDASLSAWIHPTDGSDQLYYPKGSLVGLLLDAAIRDASDNRRSLDDVMRDLYVTTYKQGRGFTNDDWWTAVSRAAGGKSFADFARRYVDGREELPYASLLPLAGFRFVADTVREPRLGVGTAPDSTGAIVVTQLVPGGALEAAGVREGDELVSIGEIDVSDAGFGARFRAKYAKATEGTRIPVTVRRDGRLETVSAALSFAPRVTSRVELDPRPTTKSARIRRGILEGTTDK